MYVFTLKKHTSIQNSRFYRLLLHKDIWSEGKEKVSLGKAELVTSK